MDPRTHRALGGDSRVRILAALREARGGLDASELAKAVGLHVNTVRSHLGLLEEAGLVERRAEAGGRPGRPRVVYRAAPEDVESPYRLLSGILAAHLSSANSGAVSPHEAGRAWGRRAVEGSADGDGGASGRERLFALLERLGFEPEADGDRVLLHRCPFREVAEAHPDVVCAVHLGLMRGALEALGSPLRATRLDPFVEPDLCVAELAGDAADRGEGS